MDGASNRGMVAFADEVIPTATSAPGCEPRRHRCQRSVRVPEPWRNRAEYFFLRKLAAALACLNAFFGAQSAHESVREAESTLRAACSSPRGGRPRSAGFDERLLPDERGGGLVLPVPTGRWEDLLSREPRSLKSSARRSIPGRVQGDRAQTTCKFLRKQRASRVAEEREASDDLGARVARRVLQGR